ncbi:hypothetical protein AU512_00215 [Lonsdalea iberica]|uniref:EAL domain-containing protein n=1 Tax=Lonsdalea iberica TaxID=1082703 RepID=A0ABX3XK51_9GAMM|nr:EAL domain-containing protein [Lonsdalea iberica]OSN11839.1 hypothetical protein AU512_00215 [Lonsdalea iberica]
MIPVQTPLYAILKYWLWDFIFLLPLCVLLAVLFVVLIQHRKRRKASLPEKIMQGINDNEFYICYQPIQDVATGMCMGAEALLRWRRPDGKWISPDIFIAAAEDEDLIIPLTHHLFEKVLKDTDSWKITNEFHLGINISSAHLESPDFVNDILSLRKILRLRGIKLVIEITERNIIKNDEQTKQVLTYLRKTGVIISIDDFGTGYCSLSYLETLPLDHLKIDRSFIDAIKTSKSRAPVLNMIIKLAQELNLKITAEGVEKKCQEDYLKASGVDFMQGYLYSYPMDSAAFARWFQEQ